MQEPTKHLKSSFFNKLLLVSEANSEFFQTSQMEIFVKIVKNENSFTIFVKYFIFNVWKGSEYASELASNVTEISFLNKFEYQR